MKRSFQYLLYFKVLVMISLMTSCKDEVALPRACISLSNDTILAPALAATFNIDVDANCDWIVDIPADAGGWATVSGGNTVGYGMITVSVEPNTGSESRELVLKARNGSGSAVTPLVLRQKGARSGGVLSISDLRALPTGSVMSGDDAMIRGVVVSDQRNGNFMPGLIAVQDGTGADCGIAVRTVSTVYVSAGEEVEVKLSGAEINEADGVRTVILADDSMIEKTGSTRIDPIPVVISPEDLEPDSYESMYVSVKGQVQPSDLHKESLGEGVTLMTEDGHMLPVGVAAECTFSDKPVPTGSGTVCGIVTYADGVAVLSPCSEADIKLDGARLDGGVMLPYVFSLMTEGANSTGRYVDFVQNTSDANKTYLEAKDGTGARFNVNLNAKSKTFYYWNDNSGHHNLQLASWLDGSADYMLFTFPIGEDLTGGFRLSFGLGGQKNAPADWELQYSTDNKTWHTAGNKVSIPKNVVFGGGKGYLYYTIDVNTDIVIQRKETLYMKLRPVNKNSISGGSVSDGYGRIVLHSCVVLDRLAGKTTARPAGAVYFEPFDGLDQGLDYRLGDRLSAMLNYCGDDIASWNGSIVNGLEGQNVRQRPGYAQIGYVETQSVSQKDYTNRAGHLVTPEIGSAGTFTLTFKAMAYKNTGVFSAGSNSAADIDGDADNAVIEILGGGTIDGSTTATIRSMNYTSFRKYTFRIENATAATRIRFSSPEDGKFTRWFIDEIAVSR